MLKAAKFSDGHRVFYSGKAMRWAWQVYRLPGQVNEYGHEIPEMITGRSGTLEGAEKNAEAAARYEINPYIEIVPILPYYSGPHDA